MDLTAFTSSLTGDIARDLVLIEEPVIGVGEVAIANHRSSHLSISELRRLASDVQLGGVLSGKANSADAIGDSESDLELIEVLRDSDLPKRLFYPTHVNRQKALLKQAIDYTCKGGYADITVSTTPELLDAGEVPALDAFRQAIDAGSPATHLTFSSDAGGSLPHYEHGVLAELESSGTGYLGVGRRAIRRTPAAGDSGDSQLASGCWKDALIVQHGCCMGRTVD